MVSIYSTAIRVFLSSTFLDMQFEREILVNKIFPNFQRECALAGVAFESVDLRWGITEDKPQDEVISFCMAQITACHPFFIGMIGGRYGWMPPNDDVSITEQEFLKYEATVAKFSPERLARGEIYSIRDDELTNRIAESGEINCFYDVEASETLRLQKLEALSRFRETYRAKPAAFEYKSLEDFESVIYKRLKNFLCHHLAQINSNGKRIEIDQQQYLALLKSSASDADIDVNVNQHFSRKPPRHADCPADLLEPGNILVLSGHPGSGKTTLSHKWIEEWRLKNPDSTVLRIHIGASGELTLNGLVRDLNDLCDVENKSAIWTNQLCELLSKKTGSVVIVIDGVERIFGWSDPSQEEVFAKIINQQNQFRDTLTNIIEELTQESSPPAILLTLDQASFDKSFFTDNGQLMECLEGVRFGPIPITNLQIQPLDEAQRLKFAESYLSGSGKSLSTSQADIISKAPLHDFDSLIFVLNRIKRFGGLKSGGVSQDQFIAREVESIFNSSRKESIANLFEAAFSKSWLPEKATKLALGLLVNTYFGLTAEEIGKIVNKEMTPSGEKLLSKEWAIIEGLLGQLLVRNGARFKAKNDNCKGAIAAYLDLSLLQEEGLRALIVDHVIERDAALGLKGIFTVQAQHAFPNELAMQLMSLPNHPGLMHLLNPVHLLLWTANDWEIALVQIDKVLEPSKLTALINRHWVFRAAEVRGEIEGFRLGLIHLWKDSNELDRSHLEWTVNKAANLLFGIDQAFRNEISLQLTAAGKSSAATALLFLTRITFSLRSALAGVAPLRDNLLGEVACGVDLLYAMQAAQVSDDEFAEMVVERLNNSVNEIFAKRDTESGVTAAFEETRFAARAKLIFTRLAKEYAMLKMPVPRVAVDFLNEGLLAAS